MYHNPRPDAMENRCAGIDFWVRGVVQYIIERDLICKEVRRVNPLNAVLRDTVSGLQKLFGDRLKNIWLYGSYARGDQTDESDIDVMALVDLSAGELARYRWQISDFSSDLDLKYGVLLAIKLQDRATFDFYGAASPFFQNVMREGVSLVS